MAQKALHIYKPLGIARYTNLNAVRRLTDAPASGITLPNSANFCLIQAETQNIRWRDDGDPTTTLGHLLYAGGDPYPYAGDLDTIRFLEVAASAVLIVSYYIAPNK